MYVMVYHHWSKLLLVEFTPYVLMIVLNCLIWRRVRAMVRMRYDVGLAAGEREREMDRLPQELRGCFDFPSQNILSAPSSVDSPGYLHEVMASKS